MQGAAEQLVEAGCFPHEPARTYRVTALRPDGGLTVAPIVERRSPADDMAGEWNAWGERLGDPMQLPASYVREHLSLGYAVAAILPALWPVHRRSVA